MESCADHVRAELNNLPPMLNHFDAVAIECGPLLKELRHVDLATLVSITARIIWVSARTSNLTPVIEGSVSSRTKVSECPDKVEEGVVVNRRTGEGSRERPRVVVFVDKGIK